MNSKDLKHCRLMWLERKTNGAIDLNQLELLNACYAVRILKSKQYESTRIN